MFDIFHINKLTCDEPFCAVPPSPKAMSRLYARYLELREARRIPESTTFEQYYWIWRSRRRGQKFVGLDDGATRQGPSATAQKITRPTKQLKGVIRTIVLLADFPDRPHDPNQTAGVYEQMLFSDQGKFPTGSMREYYRLVSCYDPAKGTGIDVQGEVKGWFRLPNPLSFYADGNSGMGDSFPRNAQGMVRDTVEAALKDGVDFTPYDALGEHVVTALFVIHAGAGAEESTSPDDIWSHKWVIPNGVKVGPGLSVQTYLTVPEDCAVGVCAHEWGHLAARWADFYDTGRVQSTQSNGLGNYCLMASGSWGNHGLTPTFPNAMLRMFHGWIAPTVVEKTTANIQLKPAIDEGNRKQAAVFIRNAKTMEDGQYIMVEYRRRGGQDAFLPDEGIAVYVVDEAIDNVNDESRLAIELMQADGEHDLSKILNQGNRGDSDDLYDGVTSIDLGKATNPPLLLPGGKDSGVEIRVRGKAGDSSMTIDITIS
ncbi:M6 family metalloprotease domain-containing protein [Reyranella sp.]|uniref:M6 family metalloprotease domain-containing protein n=1 Tax=Reyranella sp. TaxID=1929291 RepID=UPI0027300B75|nr:M6 family metalloprotease domain-containing protein [Reyranella sp.]MDP2375981.1 M6 family metalloprotease domain-containing protein [Reyranella sp.]